MAFRLTKVFAKAREYFATREISRELADIYLQSVQGDERRHRALEQMYWERGARVNIATSVIVLLGTTIASLAYYQTIRQTNIAASSFITSSRPWLKINGINLISIVPHGDLARISLSVNVKNIGHSPAQHVWIAHKTDIVLPSSDICKGIDRDTQKASEFMVFPDESRQSPVLLEEMPIRKVIGDSSSFGDLLHEDSIKVNQIEGAQGVVPSRFVPFLKSLLIQTMRHAPHWTDYSTENRIISQDA